MRDKGFDKLVEAAAERVILAIQSGVVGVCYRCGENNLLERVGKLEQKVARCIPTAETKTGRWKPYPIADGCIQCSACGILRMGEPSNYCPHCGAYMKGDET